MTPKFYLWFTLLLLMAFGCSPNPAALTSEQSLSSISDRHIEIRNATNDKPWSYWWWLGSAIDSANIKYNLDLYAKAGLGGLHVIPIYGVKGEEEKFIDYLDPKWVAMLAYTKEVCDELGLGLDMTLGTGWCFGGRKTDVETGSMYGQLQRKKIRAGRVALDLSLESKYESNKVVSILAVSPTGERIDITDRVDKSQHLSWNAPVDSMTLYILRIQGPVFEVKRPAPGGEGFMLDPFSPSAVQMYTAGFDSVFQGTLNQYVRAIYHDSYEYQADWTHHLFEAFEQKRGYDLRLFLPELLDMRGEKSMRIIADYRQTMAELHEAFTAETKKWARKNNLLFRNQGHGSPANWLDIYALSDIPETETFGATEYKIPGLTRQEAFINDDRPNRFVLKFASSAAHITGLPLVSSETNTWLREHFRVALSHSKPELDQLFLSGVNHVYYHGIAYSPREADWPGWQFYASTSFAPTNSLFTHFAAQNQYVSRVQKALRSGRPDNDILLYFPLQDIWHTPPDGIESAKKKLASDPDLVKPLDIIYRLTAHNYKDWLIPFPVYEAAVQLDDLGFAFDYISDKQLQLCTADAKAISTEGHRYKTLVIPRNQHMPLATLKTIIQLSNQGAKVIFLDQLPGSVPGFSNLQERHRQLSALKKEIVKADRIPILPFSDQKALNDVLENYGARKEHFTAFGIPYIRRKKPNGSLYFISNLFSGADLDGWVRLSTQSNHAVLIDPLTGRSGQAKLRKDGSHSTIQLQLKQGKSLIIETFNDRTGPKDEWHYMEVRDRPIDISGTWEVSFVKGGPILPSSYATSKLISWTERGDQETTRFAGTARYSIDFSLNELGADDYFLSFEKVKESALIRLNGKEVATLFAHPFRILVGKHLREGLNHLEVEVANLAANRVRDLDLRGIPWKKFYNINFVNIDYQPFDASGWETAESGLIGKVQLLPVTYVD